MASRRVARRTVGDKTMVDALEPAVAAFAAARRLRDGLARRSRSRPSRYVDSTKALVARQGRAKFLGDRAIGHPDPGATTIALIFEAIHEHWEFLPLSSAR